jgi:hypothetical protein
MMKLFEITCAKGRFTIRREAEEKLTRNQRCAVLIALLATTLILGIFYLGLH